LEECSQEQSIFEEESSYEEESGEEDQEDMVNNEVHSSSTKAENVLKGVIEPQSPTPVPSSRNL